MTIIPENCIVKLRSRALFIADPMPPTHVFSNGVLIGKPVAVPGNTIPEYRTGFGLSDRVEFDAPPVWLYARDDKWYVLAEDHCPGPGPGDFLDTWDTAEEEGLNPLKAVTGKSSDVPFFSEARYHP